jgi:hypothetical protein
MGMYAKPLSRKITNNKVFLCSIVSEFSFLARAIPYLLINDAVYASGETVTFFITVQDIFQFFPPRCKQMKERMSLLLTLRGASKYGELDSREQTQQNHCIIVYHKSTLH